MASSSSILLAMAALAALLAVGMCGPTFSVTVDKGTTANKLVLVTNVEVHELSIKEKFGYDWTDDLKESPAKTFTYESKKPLKGPIGIRFAVKHGYRVVDDILPAGFKPGTTYKSTMQV